MAWMPWQLFVSPLLKGEGQEHFRAALWHIGCAPNLSSSFSMQPLPGNLLSQHPPNRGRGCGKVPSLNGPKSKLQEIMGSAYCCGNGIIVMVDGNV